MIERLELGGLGVSRVLPYATKKKQTKERRHAEAVNAALERRRIAKRKAAAAAVKREKAAVNVALNVQKEAQQKVRTLNEDCIVQVELLLQY